MSLQSGSGSSDRAHAVVDVVQVSGTCEVDAWFMKWGCDRQADRNDLRSWDTSVVCGVEIASDHEGEPGVEWRTAALCRPERNARTRAERGSVRHPRRHSRRVSYRAHTPSTQCSCELQWHDRADDRRPDPRSARVRAFRSGRQRAAVLHSTPGSPA